MAYGNVTPPTLPTYDAETNGFYLLVFNYELGAESWYMVHLIYGAWRFQYDEGVGVTNTGNTFTRTYSDGVWSEESQNTVALALNPGVNGQVYQRIYTNANIFNGDEIWLAENTVTPLDEEQRQINMKSQLAGFIAGWCSPVRQFPKPEPTAVIIYENTVTTVDNGYHNGASATIADFPALTQHGTYRLTVNGTVTYEYKADPEYALVIVFGNAWLSNGKGYNTNEDNGADHYMLKPQMNYFYSRYPGTYHIKLELLNE